MRDAATKNRHLLSSAPCLPKGGVEHSIQHASHGNLQKVHFEAFLGQNQAVLEDEIREENAALLLSRAHGIIEVTAGVLCVEYCQKGENLVL